jgi:heterodisulfide reductase subunit A
MYAIKQAMLLSGALPLADITIYYMDIRSFGKGYEQFYQNAKAMGIEFVKGKVARITEDETQTPQVRVELIDEGSKIVERPHDLIVLSVGMVPGFNPTAQYGVQVAEDGFIESPSPNMAPALTGQEGIFAAGTATGPMDIVDTIMTAGAVAAETAAYLEAHNGHHASVPAVAAERSLAHA